MSAPYFRIHAPFPAVTDTLIIPNENFSNQKNKAHTMVRIRTGDGTLYTYIKKKRGRNVHQWDFVVAYDKSLEVKEFIRAFGNCLVKAYDHEETEYNGYQTINQCED